MKTGSCFCGKLHYEYSGEAALNVGRQTLSVFPVPARTAHLLTFGTQAICYCLTCQKLSGSTYTTNICIPENNYRVTTGTPKTYKWTHESGMKMAFSFCGDCGVNISKTGDHDAFKGLVIVQAGTLDDASGIKQAAPAAELYVKDRVSWVPELVGAGQIQEFPEVQSKL
jgi:hypothetical protein